MFWPCTLELVEKICGRGFVLWSETHKLNTENLPSELFWLWILLQASFFPVSFYLFLYYFYCSSFWSHSLNHVPISSEVSFLPSALFSFSIFIFSLENFKAFIFLSVSFPQCTQKNKHRCHLYGILKIPWRQDACQLSAKTHRRNTS